MRSFPGLSFALLLACLLAISPAAAANDQIACSKSKALATLTLAQAQREREASRMALPELTVKHVCHEDLATAEAEAKRLGKPLLLWVAITCEDEPDISKALQNDCVMCHVREYNQSTAPRIVVPAKDGIWAFSKADLDAKRLKASDVRDKLTARVIAPNAWIKQDCPNGQCPNAARLIR